MCKILICKIKILYLNKCVQVCLLLQPERHNAMVALAVHACRPIINNSFQSLKLIINL